MKKIIRYANIYTKLKINFDVGKKIGVRKH